MFAYIGISLFVELYTSAPGVILFYVIKPDMGSEI